MTESQDWRLEARCCWCHKPFVLVDILGDPIWICATPSCFDRQCRWAQFDLEGRLFNLPTPKQVELEEAVESEHYKHILIGGSRGGSKSTGLRRLAYRYCRKFPDFTVYIFRRLLVDLENDHLLKAAREVKRLGARLASHKITWPDNDSICIFAHCQDADTWKKYVGPEADLVIFDQAEMFLEPQITNIAGMVGRIRRPGWKGCVLYGENPGGPLAEYLDEVLISKTRDRTQYPAYDPDEHLFIPTYTEDNPWVDEEYAKFLMALDPAQRARYRWGRRDVFPGQYFPEFAIEGRVAHLEVSPDLPRLGGLHWGYFRPGLFAWAVVLPDGRIYIERAIDFSEVTPATVAKTIADVHATQHWTWGSVWGNPPSDIPESDTGEGVFETFRLHGVPVVQSAHDRIAGFLRLRHWFTATVPIGAESIAAPALVIDPSCTTLIKKIPTLIKDADDPEDCQRDGAEQGANALRNIVMSRPNLPEAPPPRIGRDLSALPQKVQDDIQRLREYESHDDGPLKMGDPGWPFGLDWGGSSRVVD